MFKAVTSMVKGIVGAVALLLVTTTAAMAQDKLAEGAKVVTTEMKTQLVLNDGQYSQVLDVNRAYLKKVKENNESGASAVAKAKKAQALNEEKDTKLKSVLTEVQYKKYAAGRAENTKKLKAFL